MLIGKDSVNNSGICGGKDDEPFDKKDYTNYS